MPRMPTHTPNCPPNCTLSSHSNPGLFEPVGKVVGWPPVAVVPCVAVNTAVGDAVSAPVVARDLEVDDWVKSPRGNPSTFYRIFKIDKRSHVVHVDLVGTYDVDLDPDESVELRVPHSVAHRVESDATRVKQLEARVALLELELATERQRNAEALTTLAAVRAIV
jgi:hypothetical protein